MALKIYDSTITAQRKGRPTVNINPKSGLFAISKEAATLMGITEKSRISIAQDEDNSKDWYIIVSKSGEGFIPRMTDGRAQFSSSPIANKLLDSIGVDYSSSYLIAKEPVDIDGIDLANDEHYRFVKTLANVIAVHMYAKAHNVDMDKVKFTPDDTQERQE